MTTPNTETTKAEDQATQAGITKMDSGLATVEGDDFDLGGACGLDPNDPEYAGCDSCQ